MAKSHLERLSEEEFLANADDASLGKMGGDWKGRYEEAKSRVLTNLSFDGCNAYLSEESVRLSYQRAPLSINQASNLPLTTACKRRPIAPHSGHKIIMETGK